MNLKNEFNQNPTGNTSGAMRCLSSTGSSSESDPTSTWTALLTQSMSVLSGGGDLVGSDLLNGRDCSPDADHRAGKHCSTNPGVWVSYIEPIVSTQSALPTQSALLTQSALHTQSKPILPGGRGKGSVSSDPTPHDDLNTRNHFITRFLRQTGITTPMDGCSQFPLVNSGEFLNIDQSFESFHTPPSSQRAETEDKTSEVFVTPPPSPSAAGASLGPSAQTAP
jgi:hypothetical protein